MSSGGSTPSDDHAAASDEFRRRRRLEDQLERLLRQDELDDLDEAELDDIIADDDRIQRGRDDDGDEENDDDPNRPPNLNNRNEGGNEDARGAFPGGANGDNLDDNDGGGADDPAVAAAAAAFDARRNNNINKPLSHGLSYVPTSFALAIGLFYYAMRTRQQFYLAVVYLCSSKLSLAVLGNACIAFAVGAFEAIVSLFLEGGMRLQEAEGLQDFFRWNVTETCLALTMFRSEINIQTTIEFLVLIWIKCVHHVAGLRENHFRMTQEAVVATPLFGGRIHVPTVPKSFIKLFLLLLFLQLLDMSVFQHATDNLLENGPSVNILFKFETVILLVSAWRHALLLHLHWIDGLLQHAHDHSWLLARHLLHPWKEYRATLVFAVELQAQAFQFLFYVAFFGTVLTYYGMPINLFREVYMSFAALKERVVAFLKYRKLMGRMNRFDNATPQQLDESGHTCIICRDDMTVKDGKVLPGCNHIFHKSCLREWLVQQQTCPTCRSDIDAMATRQAQQQRAAAHAEERQQPGVVGAVDGANNNDGDAAGAPPPPMPQPDHHRAGALDDSSAARGEEGDPSPPPAQGGLAPGNLFGQDPLPPSSASASSALSAAASNAVFGAPSPSSIQQVSAGDPQLVASIRAVSPWHAQLEPPMTRQHEPVRFSPPSFPSLYRVTSPGGTSVWRDDDDDDDKEGPGVIGDSTGNFGRFVRLLDCGTVVLCTSGALDGGGSVFLRVPDGWINEGDAVRVAAVPLSTPSRS
jgi:E3 ubiquitin-protein ligase synoviolin